MDDMSFIDQIANDWSSHIKKKNNWNWFFSDSDKDGVMNGVDCEPHNKKKQDGFIAINSESSKYFKVPECGICVSAPPKQSIPPKPTISLSPIKQITYNYTDTNKKFLITSNGDITNENGIKVTPIYRPYNSITKTGGGVSDYYRSDLPAAAVNAIQKGYDSKSVENLYDTHPLYAGPNAKTIAADAVLKYDNKNNVKVSYLNTSSNNGLGGYYDGQKNITLYKEGNNDKNGLLIHETAHVIQGNSPINTNSTKTIYNSVYNPNIIKNTSPNISGNNIRGDYIKTPLSSTSFYKNINELNKKREVEAYYIQQYYERKQPRNDLIESFEKKLDINTSRVLTPNQQNIYKSASDTLIKQAKDKNDMVTGVFKPVNVKKGIFSMNL